jgi:hypothetical protein
MPSLLQFALGSRRRFVRFHEIPGGRNEAGYLIWTLVMSCAKHHQVNDVRTALISCMHFRLGRAGDCHSHCASYPIDNALDFTGP